MRHLNIYFFVFLFSLLSHANPLTSFTSASCFIKTPDGLLMVKDAWSKKYSLPGGVKRAKESPQMTASRETYEETGLQVKLEEMQLLYQIKTHYTFLCSPIQTSQKQRLFPADGRNEILEAKWIDPLLLDESMWRFEDEKMKIQTEFQVAHTQEKILTTESLITPPRAFERSALLWMQWLQEQLSFFVISVFQGLSFLGDEVFFYLFLPFLFFFIRPSFPQRLMFFILITAFLNGVLKEYFQWPRPFEWISSLQLRPAHGYGFPSGHAQLAIVFWGMIGLHFKKFSWFVPLILGIAFSRVALGVHFPHDVLTGLLVGALTLVLFSKFNWNDLLFKNQTRLVSLFLLISMICFLIRPHPSFFSLTCFGLAFCIGQKKAAPLWDLFFESKTLTLSLLASLISVAGILLWGLICNPDFIANQTVGRVAIVLCLKYFGFGLWLTWGSAQVALCLRK